MAEIALMVIFPVLVIFAGASDLLTMTIPNKVSLALVAGFLGLAAFGGLPPSAILLHAAAAGLVLVVTFVFFALGWIGGGDAKLAAAISLWLGFALLPEYLTVSAVAGGALTIVVIVLRRVPLPRAAQGWAWLSRIRDAGSGVPYGIALAGAALAVYPKAEIWTTAFAR